MNNVWRDVEGCSGGAARAADFNVYWGAGGLVDSVIDVTHNLAVPFSRHSRRELGHPESVGDAAGRLDRRVGHVLTCADMGCVAPLNASPIGVQGTVPCTARRRTR